MRSRGNVQSDKYPLGEMSSRGNSRSGKCLVGEMPSRGSFDRGIVQLEMCQSGKCRSGKCSDSVFNFFNLAMKELLEKQTNFVLGLYSQAFLFLCF